MYAKIAYMKTAAIARPAMANKKANRTSFRIPGLFVKGNLVLILSGCVLLMSIIFKCIETQDKY